MTHYHRIIIYFDGASRNNPNGPAGAGWVIKEMDNHGADGYEITRGQRYLGYNVSNNQAEYSALEDALEYLRDEDISCYGLYIRGDSEIVINQLDGVYAVRSHNLIPLYNNIVDLISDIDKTFVKYSHIERNRNSVADYLANDAIDDGY